MKSINLHIIADKTKKGEKVRQSLIKSHSNSTPAACDYIVVIGGDGFMLHSLKKLQKYNKPFYGVNTGNRGFLLNKHDAGNIISKIKKSSPISLYPLEAKIKTANTTKKIIAINEVSIFRHSKQTTKLEIQLDKKKRIKELVGDGVLVATPAGSTAYNLSAKGPILNLDSQYLAVTPISPFNPRGWRGAIVSNQSKIIIKNLDSKKRPVNAVADNIEVKHIKTVEIKLNKNKKFILLYNKKFGLKERNLAEQFKF
ncbi:NAD kinase [Candidatus Pelagibacter sp. HIMB109]|uniref:NAD kinase n=1 Tax=Candidatus Pelagibacter sp. HIMB109 TaxID=3415412 RepID=UPI003F84387E